MTSYSLQGPESVRFQSQEQLPSSSFNFIPNGALVKGVVLERQGDSYIVEIQGQKMHAASSLKLDVGEQFTGIWDSTHMPPLLKLKPEEIAAYEKLSEFEQSIVSALLDRHLAVTEDLVKKLSSLLMKMGGDMGNLPALIELYARGLPLEEPYVKILSWYFSLTVKQINKYFRALKDKLKNLQDEKSIESFFEGNAEESAYVKSLLLLARPLKNVFFPYNFAPLIFSLEDGKIVSMWISSQEEPKKIVRLIFHFKGANIGLIEGELVFDADAYGVTLRSNSKVVEELLSKNLTTLKETLESLSIRLIYLNLGLIKEPKGVAYLGFDVKA